MIVRKEREKEEEEEFSNNSKNFNLQPSILMLSLIYTT